MTVVSERPKRRAASSNISYKETTEADAFEQYESSKSSKRQKKSSSHSKSSKNASPQDSNKPPLKAQLHSYSKDRESSSTDDNLIPWNWQPPFNESDYFNNKLDLKNAKVDNNVLTTRDGFKLMKNDSIYMISEPPGEPYYIGRILGFTKKDKNLTTKNASNYLFRMNWFYRPRDLNQKSNDSRLLYATMHSDDCPIMSFRGLINLKHRSEIGDLEEYTHQPNNFYFNKLFDRYMLKYYEILPTVNLVNLPPNYYKALNKRFPYVFVEIGRGKDLLSAPKNCEKCFQWCSSMDSVMCINCELFYHMMCLDPPLLRKPQRGFGWSCALCNKKLESKMSQSRGDMLTTSSLSKLISRNPSEEIEDTYSKTEDIQEIEETTIEIPKSDILPKYEELAIQFLAKDKSFSLSQRRNMEEWPYRYLGMHVKLEDAMDLQDRPYARSASRLGNKHQLTGLQEWPGHPIQYYDPDESFVSSQSQSHQKKKKGYTKKRNSPTPTASQEDEGDIKTLLLPEKYKNMDHSKLPAWLQERPKGYIERGGDDTVTLMWKMPSEIIPDVTMVKLNEYMKRCSPIAKNLGLLPSTPNFIDAILKNYLDFNYELDPAYEKSLLLTRDSLKEPTLTPEEIKRFEEGVRKYGSELYPTFKEVKTKSSADIVRFYYLWKKTPNGHKIWDNYEGRAKNKMKNSNKLSNGAVDDVANSGDDSAYDSNKIIKSKRNCECKHCHTTTSVQWFRVTGYNKAPTNMDETVIGLCLRCAKLWRRYAVQWEEPTEVFKKNQQRSGNGWKRKMEFELLTDAELIVEARQKSANNKSKSVSPVKKEEHKNDVPLIKPTEKKTLEVKLNLKKSTSKKSDKSKKKAKSIQTAPIELTPSPPPPPPPRKTFKLEPPVSSIPLFQTNPDYIFPPINYRTPLEAPQNVLFSPELRSCCVCHTNDNTQDIIICSNCGLNVHKVCYGVGSKKLGRKGPWNCDRCLNELNPIYSTNYSCDLCVTKNFNYDGILNGDPNQFADLLKPTAENQWCHLICSVFDEYCKVGSLNTHSPILNSQITKYQNQKESCQICHFQNGAITKCEFCDEKFHVTCAQNFPNFFIGFLLLPCDIKDKKCIKIQEFVYGIPKPTIVCNKHLQNQPLPPLFVPLRVPGRRINALSKSGTAEQPLISLFIQDHKKNDESVTSTIPIKMPVIVPQTCDNCHTSKSIIFIKTDNQRLCHSCYSQTTNKDYEVERENYSKYAQDAIKLLDLVNSPLPTVLGTTKEPSKLQSQPFNKILFSDILS